MGYEFKFKESEARMIKQQISLIAVILIVFMTLGAKAQELNVTPVQPVDPTPELQPEIQMEPQPWQQFNRQLTCNSMGVVRTILEQNGQYIYASGIKSPAYIPSDPFDGIIITKNPITSEYTIMLVKTNLNLACVVAAGQRFDILPERSDQVE